MRFSKTRWWLIGFVLAVAIGFFTLYALSEPREHKLPDGSVLRMEKVAYGKLEHIQLGGLVERLKAALPPKLLARFFKPGPAGMPSWSEDTPTHPNEDALYIYFSRRDATTGDYRGVDIENVRLVDDHGCVFIPTQSGGGDDGRLFGKGAIGPMAGGCSVGWFRFEAFPRRERKFLMRVFDGQSQKPAAEFSVLNPAPAPVTPTNWIVQQLPITRTDGSATFTLKSVKLKTPPSPGRPDLAVQPTLALPAYEIKEGGQPSTNWQAQDMELYDPSGNFASEVVSGWRFLCPREPAWKLRVKFFGSEESRAASNATCTLRGIRVPAAGKWLALDKSQEFAGVTTTLQGVALTAYSFNGTGNFVFSNAVPIESSVLAEPSKESSLNTSWSSGWTSYSGASHSVQTHRLQVGTPFIMMDIGILNDDQKLTVCATDEQDRRFYGFELLGYGAKRPPPNRPPNEVHYFDKLYPTSGLSTTTTFVAFDLPADVKTVDITFCVHTCATMEYIFKPPVGDAEKAIEK